jgi:hypothetical protein
MQRTIVLVLLGASCVFAQTESKSISFGVSGAVAIADGGFQSMSAAPVEGAPYTATITNESVQTLADGNRIVQTSTGTTARDSMGRTRQDAPLPPIGNMAPANAPHIVFIQDPVAQTSYTLNLTDKTAMKIPSMMPPPLAAVASGVGFGPVTVRARGMAATGGGLQTFSVTKDLTSNESAKPQTEDLGSQTIEGVSANGTRTTYTIPAGQIGNDKPISIVTEVWTSPELRTVVLSKRSDPRMGDQTFKLTNIVRSEPDPSLFSVPSDFKINDESQPILYRTTGGPAQ